MHFLGVIVIGLLVGVVAKFLTPGRDPGGFIVTILLGIGGAVVASFLGRAMGFYQPDQAPGFIAAVLGAILILLGYRMVAGDAARRS